MRLGMIVPPPPPPRICFLLLLSVFHYSCWSCRRTVPLPHNVNVWRKKCVGVFFRIGEAPIFFLMPGKMCRIHPPPPPPLLSDLFQGWRVIAAFTQHHQSRNCSHKLHKIVNNFRIFSAAYSLDTEQIHSKFTGLYIMHTIPRCNFSSNTNRFTNL